MRPAPAYRKFAVAAGLFLLANIFLNACVSEPEGVIYNPTPPSVVHTAPAHLETGVALDEVVTATFNVPMDPATLNTLTFTVVQAAGLGPVPVPGTVSYDVGTQTATFIPDNDFLKCKLYTAAITGWALDSLCNVPVDTTWSFSAPNPVPLPPVVTETSPEKLEGNVALNTVITATFNEPMNPSSITPQTFTLVRAAGLGPVPVPGTVSYDAGTYTATFTLNSPLLQCEIYTATIGASTPDSLCSILTTDSSWSFNTNKLPVKPHITHTSPADLDGNVALDGNITATFNVPMDPASITGLTFTVKRGFGNAAVPVTGAVSYDAGTNTATFNPDDSLVKCQPYTIVVRAKSLDSICSRLEVDTSWSFTIPNKVAVPPAVQTTPLDLATNVAPNTAISAVFNVAMSPFSINNQTFVVVRETESGPDTVLGTASYTPLTKTATFVPNAQLLPNQLYKVYLSATMDSLCIQLEFDTSWSFTTEDVPDPVPECIDDPSSLPSVQTSPIDLETDVGSTTLITALFNLPMSSSSINTLTFVVVRETESGPVPVSGSVTYNPLTKTASFTPDASLLPGEVYQVSLSATTDSLCVPVEFDTTWSFTTDDLPDPPPECIDDPSSMPSVQTSPFDLETDVGSPTLITALFNLPMSPSSITTLTFVLVWESDGGPVPISGTVNYDPLTKTASFTPDDLLLPGEVYRVNLSATTDSLCVPVEFDTTWTFTTDDGGGGGGDPCDIITAVSTTPTDGELIVDPNAVITATFSHAMDPATINSTTFAVTANGFPVFGTLSYSEGDNTVTFTPDVEWAPGQTYTVNLTSGMHESFEGCPLTPYSWSFTPSAP